MHLDSALFHSPSCPRPTQSCSWTRKLERSTFQDCNWIMRYWTFSFYGGPRLQDWLAYRLWLLKFCADLKRATKTTRPFRAHEDFTVVGWFAGPPMHQGTRSAACTLQSFGPNSKTCSEKVSLSVAIWLRKRFSTSPPHMLCDPDKKTLAKPCLRLVEGIQVAEVASGEFFGAHLVSPNRSSQEKSIPQRFTDIRSVTCHLRF